MPLIVKNDRFYAKVFVLFPCFFSWRGAPTEGRLIAIQVEKQRKWVSPQVPNRGWGRVSGR